MYRIEHNMAVRDEDDGNAGQPETVVATMRTILQL
jgi:hypothetical protein